MVLASIVFYAVKVFYGNVPALVMIAAAIVLITIFTHSYGRPSCLKCGKRMCYSKTIQKGLPGKIKFVCRNCNLEKDSRREEIYEKATKKFV